MALSGEQHTQVAAAERAIRLGLDRVPPETLSISPDLNLLSAQVGETTEPQHAESRQDFEEWGAKGPGRSELNDPADKGADEQREPQSREITVSVIRQLVSGVDDPDHGTERNGIASPDREARRPPLPQADHRRGDHRHGDRRHEELSVQQAHPLGKLVEGRQPLRYHGLLEVEPQTVEHHGGPGGQRVSLQRRDEGVRVLCVVPEGGTITLDFETRASTYMPADPASSHLRRFPVASTATRYSRMVRRKNSPART